MGSPESDKQSLARVGDFLHVALLIRGTSDARGVVAVGVRLLREGNHPITDHHFVTPALAVVSKDQPKSPGHDGLSVVFPIDPRHRFRRAAEPHPRVGWALPTFLFVPLIATTSE